MSEDTRDTMITAAVRSLDPATSLTDEELERAETAFARIVATPHPGRVPTGTDRPRRRRTLVLAGLVGAVGAGVPSLLLSGGSAFASWSPQPEPLTTAAASAAAATCRAALGAPDRGEPVAIAERRGGWTYVVITGPRVEAICLMPDDLVGREDPADHQHEGFFGSYTTDPVESPAPAPDRIVETESMGGSVPTPSLWPGQADEGWFSSVQGHVGTDVTGVTVHPPVGPDVEASVAHGRFAAWWPSDQPSSDNNHLSGAWTYTVTLVDGSTRRVGG